MTAKNVKTKRAFIVVVLLFASVVLCSCNSGALDGSRDPFAGDWQGSGVDSLGNEYVFAAKVIAMGEGQYRMLVLDEIDSEKKPMHVMDGVLEGNEFPHAADGGIYVGSGKLDGNTFTGYYKGPVDGSYKMERLARNAD